MSDKKCPYCERESLTINEHGRVDCETKKCNFQDKSKDEVIELRQAEYEEEHAKSIRQMQSYDGGKLP